MVWWLDGGMWCGGGRMLCGGGRMLCGEMWCGMVVVMMGYGVVW